MAAIEMNPISGSRLEEHASALINSWEQEFSINNLELPLTKQNQEGRRVGLVWGSGIMRCAKVRLQ